MEVIILLVAMVVVGFIAGYVAGLIWKDNRPYGVRGDYIIAIISAIVIGLIDWYLIPALGFSDLIRNIGLVTEPVLGAIGVLWLVRIANKR
jgi:uncharacterized membrane protein YeaQ/YmgE (transglycosylase-associated protein family)